MALSRPEVIDGRGRAWRLVAPPVAQVVAALFLQSRRAEATRLVRMEAGAFEGAPTLSFSTLGLRLGIGFGAVGAVSLVLVGWGVVHPLHVAIFGILIPVVVPLFFRAEMRRHSAEGIAAAYVRGGVCPGCGYGIGASPVEEDGCVMCAECGAA